LAANALAGLVRGATAESGLGNPDLLATIARVAVWALAIVIAVNQIGIATTIVNTLFMATVGAVAVAFALAFGLGGRETAGEIVRGWYEARSAKRRPSLARQRRCWATDTGGMRADYGVPSARTSVNQPRRAS